MIALGGAATIDRLTSGALPPQTPIEDEPHAKLLVHAPFAFADPTRRFTEVEALRLSKTLLADAAIEVGDEVKVVVQDGLLMVTPVRRVRGGHDLRDLVRRIPKGARASEMDWDPPVGREAW